VTDEEITPFVGRAVLLAVGEPSYPQVWTGNLVRTSDGRYRAERDDGPSPDFEAATIWKIGLDEDYAV
jgi:hypothetical protein